MLKEGEEMASTLADILVTLTLDTDEFSQRLRQAGQELNNFRNHVRQVTSNMENDFTNSMGNMGDSMSQISGNMNDTTNSVQDATNDMSNSLGSVSRNARRLSRELDTSLRSARRVLVAGTQEFREFGMAGRRVSVEIREEFSALPRHLQRYVQRLREAGQSTESFARLNQLYSQRVIESMRRSNDYLQNRTSQSMRLLQSMRDNTNLAPLTSQFLNLGNRLEQTARQGTALNLALQRIGPNASLRDLRNEMRLITQGVARARGAFLGFGIIGAGALAGMIYLAAKLDERVGEAGNRFKESWIDAFQPWITAIATATVAVLDFLTGINNMINKFSEAHPVLFKMVGAILLLTAVFGALLAPLAVTGVMAEGVAASFAVLWTTISPFVLGMLAVVGVALAVAVAVSVLWVSIKELWKNSEAFRTAWINIWNEVKTIVTTNLVEPVKQAWGQLKQSFSDLIATVTGGSGTMGNLWKWLGDIIAVVVNGIASAVLPIFSSAVQVLGTIVVGVINGIATVFGWLASVWTQHGATITAVAQTIWSAVQQAFSAISSFIMANMPQIKSIVSDTFNAIQAVISFVMAYIAPVVVGAFKIIASIIKAVMPAIKVIVVGTWENIKSVITSALNIIQNAIQLFSNILKGNWKGAWENVKAILKNAVVLIWNLIQLYFLGKLLAPLKGFASSGLSIIKGGWAAIKGAIVSAMSAIRSAITSGWNAIKAIVNGVTNGIQSVIRGGWSAIRSIISTTTSAVRTTAVNAFNGMKSGISTAVNAVKSTVSRVFNAVKSAIINPVQTAKDKVLGIIAKIVSAFASMKISIPKFKLPSISVGSKSFLDGKVKVPTFKVNWNAKGAIFNGASILGGGQGVGEAGAEAVMPINHKRYMKPYASAVAQHLSKMSGESNSGGNGGNQYTIQFNEPVVIREDADIQRIVDEMERRKRTSERAKGVFSY